MIEKLEGKEKLEKLEELEEMEKDLHLAREHDEKEGKFHFEITFERPDVEMGTTYFDTAKLIQRLDVNDPDWLSKTTTLIKRFTHHEKLSVYGRIFNYTDKGTRIHCYFEMFLKDKKETHRMLYDKLSEEISNWEKK